MFAEERNVHLFLWVHLFWAVTLRLRCHFLYRVLLRQLQRLFLAPGPLKVQVESSPSLPPLVLVEVMMSLLLLSLSRPPEERQQLAFRAKPFWFCYDHMFSGRHTTPSGRAGQTKNSLMNGLDCKIKHAYNMFLYWRGIIYKWWSKMYNKNVLKNNLNILLNYKV